MRGRGLNKGGRARKRLLERRGYRSMPSNAAWRCRVRKNRFRRHFENAVLTAYCWSRRLLLPGCASLVDGFDQVFGEEGDNGVGMSGKEHDMIKQNNGQVFWDSYFGTAQNLHCEGLWVAWRIVRPFRFSICTSHLFFG